MSVSLDVAEDAEDLGNTTTAAGASRSFSSDVALTVEHCACPPNYEGTSCEVSLNPITQIHEQDTVSRQSIVHKMAHDSYITAAAL